jgi:hypothetical protein
MRIAYLKNIQSGRAYLNLVIAAVIFLLVLVYLYQSNNLVKQNYVIRNCHKEYNELQNQYRKVEAEISQAQSLGRLQEAVKGANMLIVNNASYLGAGRGRVVVNFPGY